MTPPVSETKMSDAVNHLDEALRLLTGEVYRVDMDGTETKMEGMCTIVMDLHRIDRAIGSKGESIFAGIADIIQAAYVEITAARKALMMGDKSDLMPKSWEGLPTSKPLFAREPEFHGVSFARGRLAGFKEAAAIMKARIDDDALGFKQHYEAEAILAIITARISQLENEPSP